MLDDITVSLDQLNYPCAGDAQARVTHLCSGKTVSLVDRIGKSGNDTGDGAATTGPVRFNDAFTGNVWEVFSELDRRSIAGGDVVVAAGAVISARDECNLLLKPSHSHSP